MDRPDIVIRHLDSVADFHAAEVLQREIWNMAAIEIVPLHLLLTAQKNGGLVLGAFDGEHMIGFLFGFLGSAGPGRFKHCSHMMGVMAAYRGRGIGEGLKRFQRAFVHAQGLDLITWTYDPLERVNARLNLHTLGAICRVYLRDVYGELRDEINKALPTDRFEVEWRDTALTTEDDRTVAPPARTLDDLLDSGYALATETDHTGDLPRPVDWQQVTAPAVLVEIPRSFQQIKRSDMALAAEWRAFTRAIFETYFATGYVAVDVVDMPEGSASRCFYVLQPDESAYAG